MAGTCKRCKGQTTNTRAASPSGLCFGCQPGGNPKGYREEKSQEMLAEFYGVETKMELLDTICQAVAKLDMLYGVRLNMGRECSCPCHPEVERCEQCCS